MGRKYFDQRLGVNVATATLGSSAVSLKADYYNFVTYGTSGVANDMLLPNISYKGQQVVVVVDNNTTSIEANINTGATGDVFWGTTFNTATIGTTGEDGGVSIELTAVTTAAWAVSGMSSTGHWTLSATTGSTGQ